jgi:CheY-like chemotaxis protein
MPGVRASGSFQCVENNGAIIVADDDDGFREIVQTVLEEAGFGVFTAANADQVLALIERGVRPRLVVCDLHMPGLGVSELVERLAADERTRAVRVAVMTGERKPRFPKNAIRLDKPFSLAVLLKLARDASGSRPASFAEILPPSRR